MDRDRRFWDRIAEKYARRPVDDQASYQRKLALTREHLTPEMSVLEFGCGTGTTAIHHAPAVAHVEAVDFSAEMIAICRRKAAAANVGNVTFRQAAIEDIPPPSDPADGYDVVMGHSILHLVADLDAVIRRVHDLLKPGGYFVSSTTCLNDGYGFVRYLAPIGQAIGKLPLLNFFTQDGLVATLERTGFAIEHRWQPAPRKAVFIVARKAAG